MTRPTELGAGAVGARNRIIAAAEALALERGPGNISMESVAERAGLSKGGVLYHFRTKAELLAALVSCHIAVNKGFVEQSLATRDGPNATAEALIDAYCRMRETPLPPPCGVLAAVAEHPDFLDPLRAHQTETVGRLREGSADPDLATIAYLALEGLKALHLFGFEVLNREQEDAALARMLYMLRDSSARG